MAPSTGHGYRKTEIGGNARVQQGDCHIANNFNFASVNTLQIFTTTHGRQLLNSKATAKRLRDCSDDDNRYDGSAKRRRIKNTDDTGRANGDDGNHGNGSQTSSEPLPDHYSTSVVDLQEKVSRREECQRLQGLGQQEQGVYLVNEVLRASGSEEISLPFSRQVEHEIPETPSLDRVQSILEQTDTERRGFLLGLIDRLRHNQYFPPMANILLRPKQQNYKELIKVATSAVTYGIQLAPPSIKSPAQDMIATLLAILTVFAFNGTSGQSSNAVTAKQQSRKLPLLAGLFAFAIARYLCFPQISRAISELVDNYIILEDPFRIERHIPMSHCAHFKMLEALLSVHLTGTTAEAFLKAGQFNLTLGKRDGPAIRKSDWSAKGRIKPQFRVVMAVYLKKGEARCMECQSELRMSATGQFACHPCGRFYGNCAAIEFWADGITRPSTPRATRVEEVDEDDEFDLKGLKNIDLRILRRRKNRQYSPTTQQQQKIQHRSPPSPELRRDSRMIPPNPYGAQQQSQPQAQISEAKAAEADRKCMEAEQRQFQIAKPTTSNGALASTNSPLQGSISQQAPTLKDVSMSAPFKRADSNDIMITPGMNIGFPNGSAPSTMAPSISDASFQQLYLPQDSWQMPMDFAWDIWSDFDNQGFLNFDGSDWMVNYNLQQ